MYETGTDYDYLNRLHQLPSTTGDLVLFLTERGDYTPTIIESGKWDKEFDKKSGLIY